VDNPRTSGIRAPSFLALSALLTADDSQARPVKLETLAKKRLAVDASIWIYQVLHASVTPPLTVVP